MSILLLLGRKESMKELRDVHEWSVVLQHKRERGERTEGEKERGREKRREIATIVIVTCIKLS